MKVGDKIYFVKEIDTDKWKVSCHTIKMVRNNIIYFKNVIGYKNKNDVFLSKLDALLSYRKYINSKALFLIRKINEEIDNEEIYKNIDFN